MNKEIEIEVDCYIPSKGGFIKPIILVIDDIFAEALKGGKDQWGFLQRDNSYWEAIDRIRATICDMANIDYNIELLERTRQTLSNLHKESPINIMDIRKIST